MIDWKLTILYCFLQIQNAIENLYEIWIYEKSKRWRNRRWLVRPINQERPRLGHFATLFQETKSDPDIFFKYTRMDIPTYNYLFFLIKPHLTPRKKFPSIISAEERLALTLRYLASGDDIFFIALVYRMGESTAYEIIKDTCSILYKVLSPIYLRPPSVPVWRNINKGFAHDWNLSNCIGAIDGKHIRIRAPPNSGSLFFNYKKFHSIVLLAACNHRYEFTVVNVGAYGSESDGGIFARSEFGTTLNEGNLNLPQELACLTNTNIKLPYFFVGDEAFKMTKNLMRPYPGHHLDRQKRIFNYRLSRARRYIENTFGILGSRWRVFSRPLGFDLIKVNDIVLACVCLHNFIMARTQKSVRNMYCPPEFIDKENEEEIIEGEWRDLVEENEPIQNDCFKSVQVAHQMRDTLAEYFLSPEGEVPWQYDYIDRGKFQD